jgi:hypothetical protein
MKILIILIFYAAIAYAQEITQQEKLNSLYNQITSLSQYNETELTSSKPIKCGFELYSQVKTHLSNFTSSQQEKLLKILQRPDLQTSILSPSGHYRIHFDTTGTNAPHYDNLTVWQSVDSIAAAADSAYNFEVGYLGYPPAPPDFGAGGDNSYDIYIMNLQGSEYGYTEPDELIPSSDSMYTAFTVIDNAYLASYNFATTGLNGAKVTVAHEYHHGIQIGNYILRYDLDAFFYELTSVSMETFVFPSIPDYYNYLPSYFNNPTPAFGNSNGDDGIEEYALAIWNIFLKQQFGYDIIKKQWELMPKMRALYAIDGGLKEYGSSFKKEFAIFSSWLYFTNYRTIPGKYFPAAANYPVLKPVSTISFDSPQKIVSISAFPTSQNFIRFANPTNNDTLSVIISSSNLQEGVNNLTSTTSFNYNLYSSPQTGNSSISGQYYSNYTVTDQSNWAETDILNNEVVRTDTSSPNVIANINYAYPNPFYYSRSSEIEIPVKANIQDQVYLNIYSISMNLVYSGSLYATQGRAQNIVVEWVNPKRNNGANLATGVYIYFTKDGSNTTTGKIAIFNE